MIAPELEPPAADELEEPELPHAASSDAADRPSAPVARSPQQRSAGEWIE